MTNIKNGKVIVDKTNEEEIISTRLYLNGKGLFFNEYTENKLEVFEVIMDEEEIDCLEEDLELEYLFSELTKEEERLMNTINKIYDEALPRPFNYFIPKETMLNIRFDVISYITQVDLDVDYKKGLVVIN